MTWTNGKHAYRGKAGNSRVQRKASKLGDAIALDRLNELLEGQLGGALLPEDQEHEQDGGAEGAA